jgi:hypothetical protein
VKAKLVFNLDEVDIPERENRKSKKAIVPKIIAGKTVHHHVSRDVKNISIVAYIMATRKSLTPYIVTSQDSKPLRKRPMHQDVQMGVDLMLKQRSKSYLDANLFLEYVNTIFVLYLTEL